MSGRFEVAEPLLPLAGSLLVSTPRCEAKGFQQAVCLVLHHSGEGSIGLLLNRTIDFDIQALWKQLSGEVAMPQIGPVRFGGPMSGPILALHDRAELAEVAPADGVYLAARLDRLQKLMSRDAGEVRIVVGQAFWKQGQLEAEVQDGLWLPIPATPQIVFAPEDAMWPVAMREVGNRFVRGLAGVKHAPANVRLN